MEGGLDNESCDSETHAMGASSPKRPGNRVRVAHGPSRDVLGGKKNLRYIYLLHGVPYAGHTLVLELER